MSHKYLISCDEKLLHIDLFGKNYIVTGANSGVGYETTKQLIKQGAHVIMVCRRVDAAEKVAKDFKGLKGSYDIIQCDLADLESVRHFVKIFKTKYKKLNGLDCNAGMVNMQNKPIYTKDGFELTWAASYYGHFLMTELLLDVLKNTPKSRIVILSSVVHAGSPKNRYKIHLDDLHYKNRKYSNFRAYGEAKVANILYAKELSERLKDTSVTTASVHPGWARSNFGSGGNCLIKALMMLVKPLTKSISNSNWEAAQTSLYCLLSDEARKDSGAYFSQHSVLYRDKGCQKGGWPMESPNPHANDRDMAHKLVEKTRELVGLGK